VDQVDLLRHVIRVLDELDIPYMLVGSLASGAYGEPRMTQDIDVVVDIAEAQVDRLCSAFPDGDFYVSREAAHQAVRHRGQFNVIHPASGNKIDFIIARNDEWGRTQLSRRQRVLVLPDLEGSAARAEDVILGKLKYYAEGGSDKHLRDIVGILRISPDQVDREYVNRWADKLGVGEIWKAVLDRAAGSG